MCNRRKPRDIQCLQPMQINLGSLGFRDLDCTIRAVWSHYMCFFLLFVFRRFITSPQPPLLLRRTLLCCEAPEMYCGLWNFIHHVAVLCIHSRCVVCVMMKARRRIQITEDGTFGKSWWKMSGRWSRDPHIHWKAGTIWKEALNNTACDAN